ncbi:hypothetical protein KKB40_03380, partial [Patescibacteria group bacterium]|nr:hypothetical protein [Patescibacteria group bacterium]
MNRQSFLQLERRDIAKLVKKRKAPRCVAIMLDGTRRVLKLEPRYQDDSWLYYENHITNLIYKSIETTDMLFDMGISFVIGPLASLGNLHRKNFMPKGLERLLDPLTHKYPKSIYKKHRVSVTFYGDLEKVKSMKGGEIINIYEEKLLKISSSAPQKRILIGIGFSTDRETQLIANMAIEFYKKKNNKPTFEMLVKEYFGFMVPPIDIFIRSNEIRSSGGLTPLLTNHDTQFYFPVAPGILSFNQNMLKQILYDYLYCRVISGGKHEHKKISKKEAETIKS